MEVTKKVFPINGRKEGVQVFDDKPFTCVDCGEEFFYTSKERTRWRVECLWESQSQELQCQTCEAEADFRRTKKYAELRREKAEAKLKKHRKEAAQRNARTKRICVTVTCDLCLISVSQSFLMMHKARMPKGWVNRSSYPSELLCPECASESVEERQALRDGISVGVQEANTKLHEFYKKDKKEVK